MWVVTRKAEGEVDSLLSQFERHDAYHRSAFCEYDRMNGYGDVCLYRYEDERGALLHPFMLRRIDRIGDQPISDSLYDIESVKGLAGPLATCGDSSFLADAWQRYCAWCCENAVVAEYVRFNPFVGNVNVGREFFSISHSQRVGVIVDLAQTEEEIWFRQYNVNQRNMTRKAHKLGVSCHLDSSPEAFDKFVDLQLQAWQRLNARSDRHHPRESLEFLKRSFGDAAPLFVSVLDGKIVAASLFLVGGNVIHYQLSARDAAYRDVGAHNQLLHTVAMWGRENGAKILHLGAGRTSSPSDELFRFKRCLSPLRVEYPVGTRHYAPEAFKRLCAVWQSQADGADLPLHSMPYREPLPKRVTG